MINDKPYIPALRFRFLTPLYDPVLRWGMRELTFKRRLIEEARIASGFHVLDLGCGTGTLTVLLKQTHPEAEIIGMDGDPTMLKIARAKAALQNLTIPFDEGMAFQLPYPDDSFDRVVSSLMFHHLAIEDKPRALHEAYRTLKSGGELLIVDFAKPGNFLAWAISRIMRRMEKADDLIQGGLTAMIQRAGFQDAQISEQFMTIFGTLALYRGKKPQRKC